MTPGRTRAVSLIVAMSLSAAVPAVKGQTAPARADEYRVKAALLYNLAKFVEWPPDAFPDAAAPLGICVLGTDPFGAALDDAVRGHRVGDRAIVLKRLADVGPGCHVLFIANSERRRLPAILDKLRGTRALTVGEFDEFTAEGGMVVLAMRGEQVRLDLNFAATGSEDLKVSARLMALVSGAKRGAEAR